MTSLKLTAKFLALVVVLNIVRYTVPVWLEQVLIYPGMMGTMEADTTTFNTAFSTFDWVGSYFYNFMMWLTFTWMYYLIHPRLHGGHVVKSLLAYGLFWLLFASISFIYMNHYAHESRFYVWSVLDALLVMPIIAVANGLLFPRFFQDPEKPKAA